MKQPFTRIAVKVGSNVLTRTDGTLDITRMSALADQIAALHKTGIEIILVSSGAVASGKSEISPACSLNDVDQRQLFSAVGQAKLINRYFELFREHGIPVGQVLTVKENFASRSHYLTQQNCMRVMLENGVIPIVNENDTISLSELMFTDNDELSGQIATMMEVQALIILSNIDGIYNGAPTDPTSHILREISPDDRLDDYIQSGKSSLGRGGMHTKARIARQIAARGIDVYIANGKRNDILTDLMERPEETPCTHFLPSHQPTQGAATPPAPPSLEDTFAAVRTASLHLLALNDEDINRALRAVADAVEADMPDLLEENRKDLARMSPSDPKYDRLKLTEARLKDIADGIRHVATLPSPLGRILDRTVEQMLRGVDVRGRGRRIGRIGAGGPLGDQAGPFDAVARSRAVRLELVVRLLAVAFEVERPVGMEVFGDAPVVGLRPSTCSMMRPARLRQVSSPVTSATARNASTECMLALRPRYGSSSVNSVFHVSTDRPVSSSQNLSRKTFSAWSSSSAAPGRPSRVADDEASSTKACA